MRHKKKLIGVFFLLLLWGSWRLSNRRRSYIDHLPYSRYPCIITKIEAPTNITRGESVEFRISATTASCFSFQKLYLRKFNTLQTVLGQFYYYLDDTLGYCQAESKIRENFTYSFPSAGIWIVTIHHYSIVVSVKL